MQKLHGLFLFYYYSKLPKPNRWAVQLYRKRSLSAQVGFKLSVTPDVFCEPVLGCRLHTSMLRYRKYSTQGLNHPSSFVYLYFYIGGKAAILIPSL